VSGETAQEKTQSIAQAAGTFVDLVIRGALERANKFNLDNGALHDAPEAGITYGDLEDALDEYGIATGAIRAFVEAEGAGDTYDADAVVNW
jgi:hypothetical protein